MSDSSSMENYDESDLNEPTPDDEVGGAENFIGLSASETESDEDNDADDNDEDMEDGDVGEATEKPQTKAEKLKEAILKRYEEHKGTKLYIRFPQKLPASNEDFEQQVHALSPLIVKAHRPRQRHARFCLVDFATQADRDAALKEIRKTHGGHNKSDGNDNDNDESTNSTKIYATIPYTEDEEFVRQLAEKKLQSLQNKRAKARLKRASKLAQIDRHFTSTVVVLNLPSTTSIVQLRKLFPDAVDIQMRKMKYTAEGTGVAAVTLPTPMDARKAVKQKLSIGGTQLVVRFDKSTIVNKPNAKSAKKKKNNNNNDNKKKANKKVMTKEKPQKTTKAKAIN